MYQKGKENFQLFDEIFGHLWRSKMLETNFKSPCR